MCFYATIEIKSPEQNGNSVQDTIKELTRSEYKQDYFKEKIYRGEHTTSFIREEQLVRNVMLIMPNKELTIIMNMLHSEMIRRKDEQKISMIEAWSELYSELATQQGVFI